MNQQYSKEEYTKKRSEIVMQTSGILDKFQAMNKKFLLKSFYENLIIYNSENIFGDYIDSSKNIFYGFEILQGENLKYCFEDIAIKDSYDVYESGFECEQQYECHASNRVKFSAFCSLGYDNSFLYYTELCNNSQNCFGCISLKKGSHCILNTPYSTQEYETLCGRIIDHMRSTGEWGEFFPHELSPFGYNETVANEYFPMTEEEVRGMPRFGEWRFQEQGTSPQPSPKRGGSSDTSSTTDTLSCSGPLSFQERDRERFTEVSGPGVKPPASSLGTPLDRGTTGSRGWNWYVEQSKKFEGIPYVPLPIREYTETIVGYETAKKNIDALLSGMLVCEISGKPFKIIRQELAFYIENSLPIPTKHPDQRHKERMQLRNPRKLYERTCTECRKDMITTYAPERPEKVVCEECYRRLVY